jgi:hypothetical protein
METQCFVCCIPIPVIIGAAFLALPRMRSRFKLFMAPLFPSNGTA